MKIKKNKNKKLWTAGELPLHTSFKSKLKIHLFSSALRWSTDLLFLSSLFHQPTTRNAYICSVCGGGGGGGGESTSLVLISWFVSKLQNRYLLMFVFGPGKSSVMEETWKTQNPLYIALITDCQLQVNPPPPPKKKKKKRRRRKRTNLKSRESLFCICVYWDRSVGARVWWRGAVYKTVCLAWWLWRILTSKWNV